MNEARRSAYLESLGIPQFLPRCPLPGAKPSARRLRPVAAVESLPHNSRAEAVAGTSAVPEVADLRDALSVQSRPVAVPTTTEPPATPADTVAAVTPQGELAEILLLRTGNVCWIDEFSSESSMAQMQLIRSLASALGLAVSRNASQEVLRWPPPGSGSNVVLGSFADFVSSRLSRELAGETGLFLVAMGDRLQNWELQETGFTVICTLSTSEMLAKPARKRQAWLDLHDRVRA